VATPPMPQFQPSAKEWRTFCWLETFDQAEETGVHLLYFAPGRAICEDFESRCLLPTPYAQTELTGNYPPSALYPSV